MVNVSDEQEITVQITISATYDDLIRIDVHDKASSSAFLHLEMTREQFINATMNRLGNTDVKYASIRNLEILGKKLEMGSFEFELPDTISTYKDGHKKLIIELAKEKCPDGWLPDLSFSSQGSFFYNDAGKQCARTLMRRWV